MSTPRCSHSPPRAADGGPADGGADDRFLVFAAADYGAARRHSSSWWWRAQRWFARFSSRTEFNIATWSQERISERNVEQIAVSRVGDGLQDFLPGQSSASSSRDPARGFEALDEPGYGVFRTFPQIQKSAAQPPHSRSELPPHSSPWTPAPFDASMVLEEEEEEESELDEAEEVGEVALMVEYVACDGSWWGQHWVPTAQQFCWWLAADDGSQLGHTIWRPPWDFP